MVKLRTENLSRRFGRRKILDALSLETRSCVLGIAGPNGSGKSTLLRCLAGLLKADGSIIWTIGGRDYRPQELTGRIGFAAPYVELYESMTVTENLEFIRTLHRKPADLPEGILALLERFQAGKLAGMLYGELSTGQRQRVKLAAACMTDPPVLCLDEPGSNLDEAGRELIGRIVSRAAGSGHMVLIASNQAEELALATEMIRLEKTPEN